MKWEEFSLGFKIPKHHVQLNENNSDVKLTEVNSFIVSISGT
jgi:hypothetical protein